MKTIKKPWGKEEIIEINSKYMLKKLTMKKGHRCSLQYHNKKKETIYVLTGKLRIFYGKTKKKLKSKIFNPNTSVTIKPGVVHRMMAVKNSVYLEASTPQNYDVVRLSDDYKRINS